MLSPNILCLHTTAGPIQYDAAVDPDIAKQKIKTHSEVAGQANVCIFPDLNTGNNTYKVGHGTGSTHNLWLSVESFALYLTSDHAVFAW